MHKSKLKQVSALISLAFMALTAEAAGLGRLTAMSGLGEPLNAEIELLSLTPEEMSSLTAAVAPEEAYAAQGMEKTAVHNAIKVDVAKKADGSPYLKLTTQQPVTEPFVDMLIQVDWATGRLLREFTVLLDPPGFNNKGGQIAPAGASGKNNGVARVQEDAKTGQAESGKISKPVLEGPDEYKTKRGDTLIHIAKQMQLEGVSLEQMLVGLYQSNQGAFSNSNMNQLKVGQIIKKPAVDDVSKISQSEARQEIRVHAKDWQAYKNKLAGAVGQQAAAEGAAQQSASGKISASAEDKAAPPAQGPRDVVRLSKSEAESVKAEPDGDKATKEKLNALQDEVAAGTQRLKDANERVAALEKQIQDMQKLLEIKNQAMADMQQKAVEQTTQPPAPVPQPVELAKPEPQPPATETAKPEQPEPVAKPAPVPQPVDEPGFLPDPILLGVGGGVLALLAGGWLFYRNKRKRSLDSFEKGILTAGGLKANTVFGNTAGGTVDTGNTSFLTDFSQSTGGAIDTHDVDPIAEAEVYMAYGREAQAEEILKDAIAKDPKRYELHLKLLEIYASRNDTEAFETIAGELYSTLGPADPTWHKIAEMGRKLEPDNPLYATDSNALGAGLAAVAGSAAVMDEFDADNASAEAGLSLPLGEVDTIGAAGELEEKSDYDNSLDFDLSGFDTKVAGEIEDAAAEAGEASADFSGNLLEEGLPDIQGMDLPELSDKDVPETGDFSMDQETAAESIPSDVGYTMPDLDVSGFDAPEISAEPVSEEVEPELELPHVDEAGEIAAVSGEVLSDVAAGEPVALDFTLDIPDSKIDDIAAEVESIKHDLPEIDLSGISLDLNTISAEETPLTGLVGIEGEPENVNTKLDLVSAYLDMDDKEGARELLEEILKEGGEKQRERAQELLSRLG